MSPIERQARAAGLQGLALVRVRNSSLFRYPIEAATTGIIDLNELGREPIGSGARLPAASRTRVETRLKAVSVW